jgi:small subunit ribosomal protein S6
MRVYELLFIVRAETTDEEVDPLIEQLKGIITNTGGTLEKTEKWGVRKLAYRVQKLTEAQYILLVFSAQADTVKEIERRLRVADLVVKYLTVRIDEKMKRIEKRKKAREKRAARKPVAPPPAAPLFATPSLPAEPHSAVPGAPGAAPATPPAAPAEPAASEREGS